MEKPRRKDNIQVSRMQDELVLYNLETRNIHALNKTSTFIWNMCDGEKTIKDIANAVSEEFNIAKRIALKDISYCISEYKKYGLVHQNR